MNESDHERSEEWEKRRQQFKQQPLTTEQKMNIWLDAWNGAEPREKGKEADAYRKSIEPEIEAMKKRGDGLELPSEINW